MANTVHRRFFISCIALCACIPAAVTITKSKPIPNQSEGVNVSSNGSANSEIVRLIGEVQKQRTKAESWDTWNIRFLFIAGFAALCLVVTAVGVSRSNRNLGKLSDELNTAKEGQLQADLRAKDREIASLTKDTEGFELDIANANERSATAARQAAEANRIAEEERLKRIQIEERLAPRALDPKQIADFVGRLRPFVSQRIDFATYPHDAESAHLAIQIATAVSGAGGKPTSFQPMDPEAFSGIYVEFDPKSTQSARPAKSLVDALTACKLVVFGPSPTLPRPYKIGFLGPAAGINPDAPIRITIGSR